MSKVFRLNQIQSDKAADYLANLGALIYVTDTKTTSVEESSNTSSGSSSTSFDRTNSYGATKDLCLAWLERLIAVSVLLR